MHGRFLPLTALELAALVPSDESARRRRDIHVYARLIHSGPSQRSKRDRTVLTGPELIRFNSKAVQLWFDQYEIFSPAIGLFFTVSSKTEMLSNVRLLLAIQALEVFHRRTSGETVMPKADFDDFATRMTEAIPQGTEPRMRDKLTGLYRFANEPSLNQRLRSIVAALTEAFGQAPAGFDARFIRKLVDTRNYYTHFSEELDDRALDGEDMYWATRRVVLLLTLLFLQRLGIAAADIQPLLDRHREFGQLWVSADRPS